MSHTTHSTIDNHLSPEVFAITPICFKLVSSFISLKGASCAAQLSYTPEIYINPKAKKIYRPLNVTSVSHPMPAR